MNLRIHGSNLLALYLGLVRHNANFIMALEAIVEDRFPIDKLDVRMQCEIINELKYFSDRAVSTHRDERRETFSQIAYLLEGFLSGIETVTFADIANARRLHRIKNAAKNN